MTLWRNFTLLRRYHSNFVFWVIYAISNAALMLLFVPLYSASISAIGTKSIVSFILIGASMLPLLEETVSSVAGDANFQLWSGIINYSFTTPVSRYIYFSLNNLSEAAISLMIYSPIYLIAIIFAFSYLTPLGVLLSSELIIFAVIAKLIFAAAEKKAEKIGFNYI